MKNQKGFTLTELIISMGLFAVLATFVSINLVRPQATSNVDSAINTVVSEIKSQQLKAMIGDTQGGTSTDSYGIYFENNSYTLFKGTSYSASDPENIVNDLPQGVSFSSVSLPSSQIVFEQLSGEVLGFNPANNSLLIVHSSGSATIDLTINKYGKIELN